MSQRWDLCEEIDEHCDVITTFVDAGYKAFIVGRVAGGITTNSA